MNNIKNEHKISFHILTHFLAPSLTWSYYQINSCGALFFQQLCICHCFESNIGNKNIYWWGLGLLLTLVLSSKFHDFISFAFFSVRECVSCESKPQMNCFEENVFRSINVSFSTILKHYIFVNCHTRRNQKIGTISLP